MHALSADHPRHVFLVPSTPDRPPRSEIASGEVPKEVSFARGETIFFEGDAAVSCLEILSGTVRCSRLTHDGRRQIYRFAGVGKMLGLSSGDVHAYSAEALTPVVLRPHRLAALEAALERDPHFRSRMLRALREELATTQTQMILLGRMTAGEKIVTFLLDLAGPDGSGACIDLPMTRADIADYLGLTIETVSRKLNELRARGLLRLETASRVRIIDPQRLEALAQAA